MLHERPTPRVGATAAGAWAVRVIVCPWAVRVTVALRTLRITGSRG